MLETLTAELPLVQTQIFGNFRLDNPSRRIHLTLLFSPESLQQDWRANGLSADFLANYFSIFFPAAPGGPGQLTLRDEISSAISYIANELIENAVKYHRDCYQDICLKIFMDGQELVFLATNTLDRAGFERLKQFIQELSCHDPADLLLRKIERNFQQDDSNVSGLGLLTIANDYSAKLGWKIEVNEDSTKAEFIVVSTMVRLSIQ